MPLTSRKLGHISLPYPCVSLSVMPDASKLPKNQWFGISCMDRS